MSFVAARQLHCRSRTPADNRHLPLRKRMRRPHSVSYAANNSSNRTQAVHSHDHQPASGYTTRPGLAHPSRASESGPWACSPPNSCSTRAAIEKRSRMPTIHHPSTLQSNTTTTSTSSWPADKRYLGHQHTLSASSTLPEQPQIIPQPASRRMAFSTIVRQPASCMR